MPHTFPFKNKRVVQYHIDLLLISEQEQRQETANDLFQYAEAGWLKPFVGKIYSLDEAPQAHQNMTTRKGAMGKDVILLEK